MRACKSLRIVGWSTAALLVAIGIAEATYANGTRAHQTLFFVALTLFAVLIVAGIALLPRRPWLGAGVASLGALLGGVSLFWTVVALLLAITIVALSVVSARRVLRPSLSKHHAVQVTFPHAARGDLLDIRATCALSAASAYCRVLERAPRDPHDRSRTTLSHHPLSIRSAAPLTCPHGLVETSGSAPGSAVQR